MNKFFDIDLPKWPALVVVGTSVTKEQAEEILIRTNSDWMSSNNHDFIPKFFQAMGWISEEQIPLIQKFELTRWNFEISEISFHKPITDQETCLLEHILKQVKDFDKLYPPIPLEYLANNQILSCWIGGPHGWCDWNGKIFSNNYNIGKWPSVGSVYNDWKKIAKAFPFLEITSQLYDGETGEEDIDPIVEFEIDNGKLKIGLPSDNHCGRIRPICDNALSILRFGFLSTNDQEVGISPEELALVFKNLIERKKHV